MPESTQFELPANEIAKSITLHVTITGYRGWLLRLAIAVRLIRLAARIAGMGLKINARQEAETNGTEKATG